MSARVFVSVTRGHTPQTIVIISQNDTGRLFIIVASADPAQPVDLDGVFFNLADDSMLGSLNFFPGANTGLIVFARHRRSGGSKQRGYIGQWRAGY
jgi:hypothetical protein